AERVDYPFPSLILSLLLKFFDPWLIYHPNLNNFQPTRNFCITGGYKNKHKHPYILFFLDIQSLYL
ncbi:MAG: hypothetical protein AB1Z29_15965, partial [Desulfobacterales bacterium]